MKKFVKVFLFVLGLVLLTGLTGCETANYEAEASAVSQKVGADTDSVTSTQINTKSGVNPFGG